MRRAHSYAHEEPIAPSGHTPMEPDFHPHIRYVGPFQHGTTPLDNNGGLPFTRPKKHFVDGLSIRDKQKVKSFKWLPYKKQSRLTQRVHGIVPIIFLATKGF